MEIRNSEKPTHRRDIDGLRAIAILPVLVFHAGFTAIPGGFLGVDIFYVISGFLISSILLRESQSTGRISIRDFYLRRIKRIAPALATVLLTTSAFAIAVLPPTELKDFAKSLIATVTFTSNIFFWQNSSYFSPANDTKPLLHTWSLSVEEQFYLLYPLLLIALQRLAPRNLAKVIVFLTICSLALAELIFNSKPVATFFLLPTRTFEITIGAIGAMILRSDLQRRILSAPQALIDLFSIAAIIGLIAPFFAISTQSRIPGLISIIPCGAASLICTLGIRANISSSILAARPLVFLGTISYSLYLWHQPIFALYRASTYKEINAGTAVSLLMATTFISVLSWKYIEEPFRIIQTPNQKRVFLFTLAGAIALIAFALICIGLGGLPSRYNAHQLELLAMSANGRSKAEACSGWREKRFNLDNLCTLGVSKAQNNEIKPSVMLLGDSHAAAIAPAVNSALQERNLQGIQATYLGCPPSVGLERVDGSYECSDFSNKALKYLGENINIHTVIIAARWTLLTELHEFDNEEGGKESAERPIFRIHKTSTAPQSTSAIGAAMQAVDMITKLDRQVIIVYPIPEVGWDVPKALRLSPSTNDDKLSTSYDIYLKRTKSAFEALDSLPPSIERIYPDKFFCNTATRRCHATKNGAALYYDDDHLSPFGASFLENSIKESLTHHGN